LFLLQQQREFLELRFERGLRAFAVAQARFEFAFA
jgi:hypothetical protein